MIVDPGSMELVSAVEEMIEAVPRETEGSVKPELLQSVLEIATDVCRSAGGGGRPARGPAPPRARDGRVQGPHDRLGRDASVRPVGGPAHRGARALPARSSTRSGSSCARSCCSACTCTSASTTPDKAIHVANGMRVHLPDPARAVHQLALLARPGHELDVVAHAALPPAAARRDPAALRGLDGVLRAHRVHGRGRRGPRLHVPVVGRAPASQPRDGRGALLRRADAPRAHDRDHRADPGDGEGAVRALRPPARSSGTFPAELLEENKWLAARYGMHGELIDLPSSDRVPTAELARRLVERLRPHARELGVGVASSRASSTCRARHGRRPPARRVAREPRHGRARAQRSSRRRPPGCAAAEPPARPRISLSARPVLLHQRLARARRCPSSGRTGRWISASASTSGGPLPERCGASSSK